MPFTAQPTEKCVACGRTVYATERSVVEDLADKKVYHKQCIRCQTCNKVLSVGQFSAMDGKFWCKPHFKQLFASKGNYDEPFGKEKRRDSAPVSAPPTSFIPEVKADSKSDKKQTSEETLAKFRKFREEGDTDKCTACSKTVYLAEKLIVEDKNEKRLFHKACFKCSVCELKLDLRNYGSVDGKIFCKNHLKEQSKINTPTASGTLSPGSFIPEVEKSNTQNSKETPEHIASKFKGLGNASDKCKACGKSVYATEKTVLTEGFGKQVTYHKQCLKCNICSVQLDVSSYGLAAGILFCIVHLKQYGKPEQAKSDNAYFVSPLAANDPSYAPGPRDLDSPSYNDDREDNSNSNIRDSRDSDSYERENTTDREPLHSSTPPPPEQQEEQREEREGSNISATSDLQGSGQSSPAQQRRRASSSLTDSSEDSDKKREDERQRKREERLRQQQEEEKKEEEEREKRRQAREARFKEISTGNEETSSVSSSTNGGDDDRSKRETEREERRKKREEERKREEEEREREEARRKREREERKRQQDDLAARELEEQEKKAEERRKKLEELKNSS